MSIKETYDWYAKEGYLTASRQGGLTLYNYTSRTVFEGNWNFHTRSARGLVLDESGEVVALPFPKFFNLGERPETQPAALPAEIPELADKYDGSLVIVFLNPETDRWDAVTRGSWDNDQTTFARGWLERNAERLEEGRTHLFELVAPWNRIVVAYDRAEMVLIGMTDPVSTQDHCYAEVARYAAASGLTPLRYEVRPLSEIRLEDPSVVNQEGYVARFSNGFRVKLKYAQYVRLHRIITGLSVKGIWEILASGAPASLDGVPDEFLAWFERQKAVLEESFRTIESEARRVFAETPRFATRKEYAAHFERQGRLRAILFRLLDGRDYAPLIWRQIEPSGRQVFKPDES